MVQQRDAQYFASVVQQLAGTETQKALQAAVDLAVDTVDAADFAGITIRHGGRVETPAMTDPVVGETDALQYELGEGPCLDAVYEDDTYLIEDMAADQRWPRWSSGALDRGIHSSLSVRLETPDLVIGGLNLYSRKAHAFTEDDVLVAHIYALNVSGLLRQLHETDGLRSAITTRHQIGVAQGLLMAHLGIDQQRAFEVLRRVSQQHNIKLRDVAARIVESNGRMSDLDWSAVDPR